MQTMAQDLRPGLWQLFRIWASIGLQSFGGGTSTVFLIQQTFIEKYQWLSMEEYLLLWNLCLFAPGINLISLTILIGRKLGGIWGIVVSLAGMLLPSGAITCLLTVGFVAIQKLALVQAVLHGIVPATAGVMFLVALRFMQPLLTTARKEGLLSVVLSVIVVLACAIALILFSLSAVVVLLCAAIIGVACFTPWRAAPPLPAQPLSSSEPAGSESIAGND